MTKVECTQEQTDRGRSFCQPSCLSNVVQNPYSNLNQNLMDAIHKLNLKEIQLKMTKY